MKTWPKVAAVVLGIVADERVAVREQTVDGRESRTNGFAVVLGSFQPSSLQSAAQSNFECQLYR